MIPLRVSEYWSQIGVRMGLKSELPETPETPAVLANLL